MAVNSCIFLCWLDCGLVSKYQLYSPMLVCLKEEIQLKRAYACEHVCVLEEERVLYL